MQISAVTQQLPCRSLSKILLDLRVWALVKFMCWTPGSDVGSMLIGRQDWKAGCGDLLRENPEMKQVHSLASAAAILERIAGSRRT